MYSSLLPSSFIQSGSSPRCFLPFSNLLIQEGSSINTSEQSLPGMSLFISSSTSSTTSAFNTLGSASARRSNLSTPNNDLTLAMSCCMRLRSLVSSISGSAPAMELMLASGRRFFSVIKRETMAPGSFNKAANRDGLV